ncbi:hypothetical protein [Mesorhizobium sp. M1405]|uniref:hypothetical protein n=1 Tax=Mesorhizobium sp. M1405 TaxID=2957098 RepID=UPI0033397287
MTFFWRVRKVCALSRELADYLASRNSTNRGRAAGKFVSNSFLLKSKSKASPKGTLRVDEVLKKLHYDFNWIEKLSVSLDPFDWGPEEDSTWQTYQRCVPGYSPPCAVAVLSSVDLAFRWADRGLHIGPYGTFTGEF